MKEQVLTMEKQWLTQLRDDEKMKILVTCVAEYTINQEIFVLNINHDRPKKIFEHKKLSQKVPDLRYNAQGR